MLVIVNPYATTVSDRLRNLVVYALQGRYDVDGDRHRGARPRDRALPRGRRRGLRRRRRVRRRRHGQRGGQRPARAPSTPLTCLPGGSTNVYCADARHPRTTSSTRPSTCCAIADDWQPREVDLGVVNDRRFLFSSGARARRQRRRARRRATRGSRRASAPTTSPTAACRRRSWASYVVRPPRLETVTDGGDAAARRHGPRPEGRPLHLLPADPDARRPRAAS